MKKYIIAGVILIGLVITINVLINQKKDLISEVSRLETNNYQLMADKQKYTHLYLRQKEITGQVSRDRDSVLKRLNLRPKEVVKIVHEVIIQKDTVIKEVYVSNINVNHWLIADTGNCFIWTGEAFLNDDSLKVSRIGFDYQNKVEETFYRLRPHKFLFFRWGKWVNYQDKKPQCGEAYTEIFEFL
jgi:hypothetical protein